MSPRDGAGGEGVEQQVAQVAAPADACLAFWSLTSGTFGVLQNSAPMLVNAGVADAIAGFRRTFQAMLDGLGWRPLTTEWDWADAHARIERGVFAEEVRRASPA